MLPEDVVWPWCLDKFKGSWMVKTEVVGDLRSRYYETFSDLQTTRPPQNVVSSVEKIMCSLVDLAKEDKLPMAIILSNSSAVLGVIAKLMTIAWPLTFHGSSHLVDSTELLNLFRYQRDEFEQEIALNTVRDLKSCGLLFWERIDMEVVGTKRQGGRFASLLAARVMEKSPTVFSAACTSWRSDLKKDLVKQAEENFGSSIGAILQETSLVLKIESPAPGSAFKRIKL